MSEAPASQEARPARFCLYWLSTGTESPREPVLIGRVERFSWDDELGALDGVSCVGKLEGISLDCPPVPWHKLLKGEFMLEEYVGDSNIPSNAWLGVTLLIGGRVGGRELAFWAETRLTGEQWRAHSEFSWYARPGEAR